MVEEAAVVVVAVVVSETEEDAEESSVEDDLLKQALKRLSCRAREIIEMRYGLAGTDELTQKEVADKLGISQSYISRLEKKIISRLKKEFTV